MISIPVPEVNFLSINGGTLLGNLLFSTDNTLDIGASGATRPRTLYLGTSLISPSVGLTGNRITNGWFTDLTVTNAISGSITGNAATVTTNANLTGVVTSTGNATSIASGAIKANMLQSAASDLGAADVNIVLSNSNGSYVTNLTLDGLLSASNLSGSNTGDQKYFVAGIITLPSINDNGDGTVTIGTNGVAIFYTDSTGNSVPVSLNLSTGNTLTMTDGAINYIYTSYNSGSPIFASTTTPATLLADYRLCACYRVVREGTTLYITDYDNYALALSDKQLFKDVSINGFQRQSGLALSTAETRISTVGSGVAWLGVQSYSLNENKAGTSGTLCQYYLVSGVWNKSTVTSYDSSYYSDGTNRQSLTSNRYVAKYFFREVGSTNRACYVHGNQYTSFASALAEVVPSVTIAITSTSIYVGKIVIQEGTANGTAYPRDWGTAVVSATSTDHSGLSNLSWTSSGHVGTASNIAGFDGTGIASLYTLSGTGTVLALTNSPAFVTPNIGDATGNISGNAGTVTNGLYTNTGLLLDQTTPQSIINGKPTVQGFLFNTNPTVGAFAEGKLYYDYVYKTLACNIDTDVNLQIGQETMVRAVNNTGSNMLNGQAVYLSGASGVFPTIALGKADALATSYVVGVLTQNINTGTEGFATVRGVVHDVDTSAWNAGDNLYLSDATAGALTNVEPTPPSISIRVGRVIVKDATVGSIYVNPRQINQLSALSDVNIINPVLDEVMRYNGSLWVNGAPATSSASNGINFYFNDTAIIPISANNVNEVTTFSKTPDSAAEVVDAWACTNNTVLGEAYLYNAALGRTSIDAGVWEFAKYASVSSTGGGRVSTLSSSIRRVRAGAGTVTITGSGTSRTATASTGTPFATALIDVGGTIITDSYLQTVLGLYRITARTSDVEVTISTPSGYSNESTVAFSVWKQLFSSVSPTITSLATNYSLYTTFNTQPAYAVLATDKLGCIMFATSNNTTTVNFVHSGTTRNSYIVSPLITLHGNLAGLQGGTGTVPTEEYFHLTSAQHTVATQAATASLNGYLASGDFVTFAAKESALTFGNGLTRTVNAVANDLITGLAGGQTIIGGTLTTQTLSIRGNAADLTTGQVNFLGTKAASSETVASVTMAGGLGISGAIQHKGNYYLSDANYLYTPNITMKSGLSLIIRDPAANAIADFSYVDGSLSVYGTGTSPAFSNMRINTWNTTNNYIQNNIQNLSTGAAASSDWIATADNGTDTTNYIDMGINGSGWATGTWTINGADDGYLYTSSSNLAIGTASAKTLTLFTGGTLAANARMSFASDGKTTIGSGVPTLRLTIPVTAAEATTTDCIMIGEFTQLLPSITAGDLLHVQRSTGLTGNARALAVVCELNNTTNNSAQQQGLNCFIAASPTSTANFTSTSGALRNNYGIFHRGTGTITTANTIQSAVAIGYASSNNAGTITNATPFLSSSPTFTAFSGTAYGTMTNFMHFRAVGGAVTTGGTLTNRYGLYIEDLVGGTNRWGIYQIGATDPNYLAGKMSLGVGTPATMTNCQINIYNTVTSYFQSNIQNLSNNALASSDLVATCDDGTDTTGFINMGINSSGFSNVAWTINGARDCYIYTKAAAGGGGNLSIGTADATYLSFFTGGLLAANERMRILADGKVGIGTTAPDKQLEINSTTGDCLRLTYNDSNGSAAYYSDFLISSAGYLTINPSGGKVSIGAITTTEGVLNVATETPSSKELLHLTFYSGTETGTQDPLIRFRHSMGTQASPSTPTSGKGLGTFYWQGWDGNGFTSGALMAAYVDGTISDGVVPGKFRITTYTSAGALNTGIYMMSTGNVGIGVAAPTALTHIAASTTARASLCLDAGTAPTSPVAGDIWNDSTQKSFQVFKSGVVQSLAGIIFTQTASATVGNTTTETALVGTGIGVTLLPANFWTVGKTIRMKMFGHISCTAADTASVRIKVGSVTVASSIDDAFPVTLTNSLYIGELLLTCRTTGATGTLFVQGYTTIYAASSADMTVYGRQLVATSAVTIDTTATGQLNITYQWSNARAGNTITSTNATIEVLN